MRGAAAFRLDELARAPAHALPCSLCGQGFSARARLAEHQLRTHRARLSATDRAQALHQLGGLVLTTAQISLLEIGARRALPTLPGHLGRSLRQVVMRGWFSQVRADPHSLYPLHRLTLLGRDVLAARNLRVEAVSAKLRGAT